MLKTIYAHQQEGLTQQELIEKLLCSQGKPLMGKDMFNRTHFRLANWGRIEVERGVNKWRCTNLGLKHINTREKPLQDRSSLVQ